MIKMEFAMPTLLYLHIAAAYRNEKERIAMPARSEGSLIKHRDS